MAFGNKTAAKQAGKAVSQSLAGSRRKTIKGPVWEAEGLAEAGLNRILAITQPTGAAGFAAPMGAVSSAVDVANMGMGAIGKGVEAFKTKKEMQLIDDQREKLKSEAWANYGLREKFDAEARHSDTLGRIAADTALFQVSNAQSAARERDAQATLLETQIPSAKALQEFYANPAGKGSKWWSEFMKNVSGPFNFSAIGRSR